MVAITKQLEDFLDGVEAGKKDCLNRKENQFIKQLSFNPFANGYNYIYGVIDDEERNTTDSSA